MTDRSRVEHLGWIVFSCFGAMGYINIAGYLN